MIHTIVLLTMLALLLTATSGCATAVSSDPLRVMCFNIRCSTATGDGENHWPKRREIFFKTVERFDPDLLGAQEVVSDQADELRARFARTHTFIGVGRDDGKRKGEFAPILFRRDRFEMLDHGHIWLSESPEKPGSVSWDSALTRMATWVKLRDKRVTTREPIVVINTHWDHVGEVARAESAKLLRARLQELGDHHKLAILVMGDLNCTEDDPPLPILLGAGLTDAYREVHPTPSGEEQTFHGFQGASAGSRIDFILHNARLRATSCAIERSHDGGRYPSDHFPITCILQWSDK